MKRIFAELKLQPSGEILEPGFFCVALNDQHAAFSTCIRMLTYLYCSVKIMLGPAPHTQLDADLAAGMGKPDNGPKLMAM